MRKVHADLFYSIVDLPTPPGGDSPVRAIQICVAPKGMVFQPFW